ncbi:uncharacterized protein [Paramisgurnus dabryanus]|uniref:uncharacterized protein n=1 Tax=Paramisgurnus dabryanus TaxID=90735 RepID=UPI003CCFD0F8
MMMIIICLFLSAGYCLASEIPECPTAQEILCEKLCTANGYTYTSPPMNHLTSECEHGWYYPNGKFIKDSTGGMTAKNLTLSICEDVEWQIVCPTKPLFNCTVMFAVPKNSTALEPQKNGNGQEDKKDERLPVLKIVFIGIGIGIAIVVGVGFIIWKYCPGSKGQNGCRQNGVV